MPSLHLLLILLLLAIVSTSFILQDLPLERFERSGFGGHHDASGEFMGAGSSGRQTRSRDVYRPGANFWQKYRMMSG